MFRLPEALEHNLVTNIEALRMPFISSTAPSVADPSDFNCRDSVTVSTSRAPPTMQGNTDTFVYNRVPLTKESLDLMDTPVPSGVLAEEFAYHGLAPSFLKESHAAREMLDEIYTEIKRLS